jgi:hypothetical protein
LLFQNALSEIRITIHEFYDDFLIGQYVTA